MTNKFKVGDFVKLIKGDVNYLPPNLSLHGGIKFDVVYKVAKRNTAGIILEEIPDSWYNDDRFELVIQTPHKWAKEIKAWADGAKIEHRFINNGGYQSKWTVVQTPEWRTKDGHEYRIYQEPKPDVVGYMCAANGLTAFCGPWRDVGDNIKCTFDGETGKLKAVELIK